MFDIDSLEWNGAVIIFNVQTEDLLSLLFLVLFPLAREHARIIMAHKQLKITSRLLLLL